MFEEYADVAKLVDALGLGPSGATLESSSLSVRTHKKRLLLSNRFFVKTFFLNISPDIADEL